MTGPSHRRWGRAKPPLVQARFARAWLSTAKASASSRLMAVLRAMMSAEMPLRHEIAVPSRASGRRRLAGAVRHGHPAHALDPAGDVGLARPAGDLGLAARFTPPAASRRTGLIESPGMRSSSRRRRGRERARQPPCFAYLRWRCPQITSSTSWPRARCGDFRAFSNLRESRNGIDLVGGCRSFLPLAGAGCGSHRRYRASVIAVAPLAERRERGRFAPPAPPRDISARMKGPSSGPVNPVRPSLAARYSAGEADDRQGLKPRRTGTDDISERGVEPRGRATCFILRSNIPAGGDAGVIVRTLHQRFGPRVRR